MPKAAHQEDVEQQNGAVDAFFKSETETGTPSPSSDTSEDYKQMSTLQRFASKFNVETRGIERVPEEERNDNSYLNIGSMVRNCFAWWEIIDSGKRFQVVKTFCSNTDCSGWPLTSSSRRSQLEFSVHLFLGWDSLIPP